MDQINELEVLVDQLSEVKQRHDKVEECFNKNLKIVQKASNLGPNLQIAKANSP